MSQAGLQVHTPVGAWLGLWVASWRRAIESAPEIFERLAAILAGARQQEREDLRREQRVWQGAVSRLDGDMQRHRYAVESSAAQTRDIASREGDGVDAFVWEGRSHSAPVRLEVEE